MKRRRTLCAAVFTVLAGASCTRDAETERAFLVVSAPEHGIVNLGTARLEPENAADELQRIGAHLVVTLNERRRSTAVTLRADGACRVTVAPGDWGEAHLLRRELTPLVDFGDPIAQAGFGERVNVKVRAGCREAAKGRIEWRQVEGPPLEETHIAESGFRFSARTAPLEKTVGRSLPWGIVPISPRTRGMAVMEATFIAEGAKHVHRMDIAPIARSRGLPNVSVGQRVLLGGDGWRVATAPPGASARLEAGVGHATFLPGAQGRWRLEDGGGRRLDVFAGRYDSTPLDCGRSECHQATASAASASPMTLIFQRTLSGELGETAPACAVACHATGEPGLEDGGYWHVTRELDRATPTGVHAWMDLTRDQRRVGGVGCLACHGPGVVPEPAGRTAILSADVCAYCHDAPPRYGHVTAWRGSAMATADRDPQARTDAKCARCHTTDGFLAHQGALAERRPPAEDRLHGIACAACHAVHPTHAPPSPGLLRKVRVPPPLDTVSVLAGSPSAVCVACHAPAEGEPMPSASAAALWAGRSGVDPDSGDEIIGPAPHVSPVIGCVTCHSTGPTDVQRGASHRFAASACGSCHGDQRKISSVIAERAANLWNRLSREPLPERGAVRPPHASGKFRARDERLARAAYDVLLVLEDRGAAAHNPAYATKLLDAAERVLQKKKP